MQGAAASWVSISLSCCSQLRSLHSLGLLCRALAESRAAVPKASSLCWPGSDLLSLRQLRACREQKACLRRSSQGTVQRQGINLKWAESSPLKSPEPTLQCKLLRHYPSLALLWSQTMFRLLPLPEGQSLTPGPLPPRSRIKGKVCSQACNYLIYSIGKRNKLFTRLKQGNSHQ